MTRECEKLQERMPELAEGTLAGRALARAERHIAACERCAAELAELRAMLGVIAGVKPEPLPEGLVARVRVAVSASAAAVPAPVVGRRRRLLPAAVAAAAAMTVMALSYRAVNFRPTPSLPTSAEVAARHMGEGAGSELGELPALGAAPMAEPAGEEGAPAASGEPEAPRKMAQADHRKGGGIRPRKMRDGGSLGVRQGGGAAGGARGQYYASAGAAGLPEVEAASLRGSVSDSGNGVTGPAGPSGPPLMRQKPGPRQPGFERSRVGPMESREHQFGRRDLPVATVWKWKSEVEVPPVWARLVVGTMDSTLYSAVDEGPVFKLAFGAEKAVDNMSVVADTPHGREVLWQGRPEQATTVMLTRRHFGAGPAAIPIAINFDSTQRKYVLFVPMLKRLGETALGLSAGVYTGQSLRQVLADFSAQTGLVLLAEEPLDERVEGCLPQGETDAVLAQVAEQVGLQVEREDGLLRNLTQKPAE